MLNIAPFKAIFPRADMVETVSSENFDAQNKQLSVEEMKLNPMSYLHVSKPHLNFPEEKKNVARHFPFALKKLEQFLKEGVMLKAEPHIYIYRQIKDGRIYQGVIAGVHADNYVSEKIKKHELTRTDKEDEMVGQMRITKTVGTAVLVTYEKTKEIEDISKSEMLEKPHFDIVQRGVRHTIWIAKNEAKLCDALKALDHIYIADGHHRSASLVRYAQEQKEKNPNHTGKEPYNYLQTYFVPSDTIYIYEYNRLIDGVTNSSYHILKHICENFEIEKKKKDEAYHPKKKHCFGMYYLGNWYKLKAKPEIIDDSIPLKCLDVQILEDYLLKPVFNIMNSKTDERLSFVDGTKGLAFLEERVNKGKADIAFTLFPTEIEQVMAVADIRATMPPKSTWIEPKMRTGFVVQDLS